MHKGAFVDSQKNGISGFLGLWEFILLRCTTGIRLEDSLGRGLLHRTSLQSGLLELQSWRMRYMVAQVLTVALVSFIHFPPYMI